MAVGDTFYANSEMRMKEVCDRNDLNRQRGETAGNFQSFFRHAGPGGDGYDSADMLKNPQLLVMFLKDSVQREAPDLLTPIIEEGIRDGSIQSEYPRELAEVLMLIGNL